MPEATDPTKSMALGVCYYPEHWPERQWSDDAREMRAIGIEWVRIAEFAWSGIEPRPGAFDWAWLDRAIETLADAGLKIVLCTPTATPPRWLVSQHPEILPVADDGQVRGFGSRRHYCFSSPAYREQSRRITREITARYGDHPAVCAWQTDNEYGCHDTVISYSTAAAAAFRQWLADRYESIQALNEAWGTVFWSQEYAGFDEIELPNATVTEANPAHRLDFRRFSSDQVVAFNREQVDIIRENSPGRTVLHNGMGLFTEYDSHDLGRDLDAFAWDSYPLGFLDSWFWDDEAKRRYHRTGHPDIAAFHHDLYRGAGDGRMWVMEQQPGPVNWAAHNPSPAPGMVRLWTWEAFAHGAEVVSYFRWRQAPFAQEQMHAGLQRPDGSSDWASAEARQVADEIDTIGNNDTKPASVALVFDYTAQWVFDIQPQCSEFSYFQLAFKFYSALRQLGLDVDILAPSAAFESYDLVVVPSLPIIGAAELKALDRARGQVILGPRSGSRTADFKIPDNLPPGPLADRIPIRVERVDSVRPDVTETVTAPGYAGTASRWFEHIGGDIEPEATGTSGRGVVYRSNNWRYLGAWPDDDLCSSLVTKACDEAGIETVNLPDGLRLRSRGSVRIAVNYGDRTQPLPAPAGAEWQLGQRLLEPAGVAIWR